MAAITQPTFNRMIDELAADTTTFANPDGDACPHVILCNQPFTPALTLTYADLAAIEADFDGYIANGKSADTGTQNTAFDPLTSQYLLQLKVPAGGFRWETTGLGNLPQTIYGFGVGSFDSTNLYFAALFPTPIVLTAVNQVVEVVLAQLSFTPVGVS